MLRRARWVVLLALFGLSAGVVWLLVARRAEAKRERPQAALPLPGNTSATARDWTHDIKSGDRLKVRVSARNFRQIKEPSTFLLDGLEMRIFSAEGNRFDLVKTAQATFDLEAGSMFADGQVEIEMDVAAEAGEPAGRLTRIRSSGVTFDSKTMRVTTPRHAEFDFDAGDGESEGAIYDPGTKELRLNSHVRINWRGAKSGQPMRLQASHLVYREAAGEILLSPPARLEREGFLMEAADTVVLLQDGNLDRVEATKARGWDRSAGRNLEYQASRLVLRFAPGGVIQRMEGIDQARLVATGPGSVTRLDAGRVDLNFRVVAAESLLEKALATGSARVESRALAKAGAPPPAPRVLTSEVVELIMCEGGKEVEIIQTHTPGQVEFPPAQPADKRRVVTGERLSIFYGAGNAIERFRAVQAETRTEAPARSGKPLVTLTRSQDLQAFFDPQTSQMTRLEQWNRFEYEQEERRARAEAARLELSTDLITLERSARVWDSSGSTAADEIVLDQRTGQMAASGKVASVRLPDKKQKPEANGTLLSGEQPMQARAARMLTFENSQRIRYEGGAVLWQGGNRVAADRVEIQRAAQRLIAEGKVVTTFLEQAGAETVQTVVRAPRFEYSGETRLGDYTGGAWLQRNGLEVRSQRLRAWFGEAPAAPGTSGAQLERLLAEGSVKIAERMPGRTRTGASETAEHDPREERTVLSGGAPFVNDSQRGITRGNIITFLAREDRLIVDNTGSGAAVSRIQRSNER